MIIATGSRDVPGVREAIRRQDSRVSRRFHALLGRRGRLLGPRNLDQSHAAERLVQAETLWAMLAPEAVSGRKVLRRLAQRDPLRRAHLGRLQQRREPDRLVRAQWKIKQAFALDGDVQSKKLLAGVAGRPRHERSRGVVDVFNTSSWPRTDLVVLSKEMSTLGDVVKGPRRQAGPFAAALDRRAGIPGPRRSPTGRPAIRSRRASGGQRPGEGRRHDAAHAAVGCGSTRPRARS